MFEPVRLGEVLPTVMQNICQRAERRELKKRCLRKGNYYRHKRSMFARIDEPRKGRCFGMAE